MLGVIYLGKKRKIENRTNFVFMAEWKKGCNAMRCNPFQFLF